MLHKEMENKTIDNVRVIDCFIIVMSDIFKLNCAIFNLLQFFVIIYTFSVGHCIVCPPVDLRLLISLLVSSSSPRRTTSLQRIQQVVLYRHDTHQLVFSVPLVAHSIDNPGRGEALFSVCLLSTRSYLYTP